MRRIFIASGLCFFAFGSIAQPLSAPAERPLEQPVQAPGVKPEEKPKGALKDQEPAQSPKQSAQQSAPAVPQAAATNEHGEGASKAQQGSEEGTEFLPVIMGVRLKITDFVISLFTAMLALFTYFLWRSTDKLWAAGEAQRALSERVAVEQAENTKESIRISDRGVQAAIEANRLNREAFENARRPWITISIAPDGDIVFSDYGMQIPFILTVRNIGPTPAMNVTYLAKSIPRNGEGNISEEIRELIDSTVKLSETRNTVVLPNETDFMRYGSDVVRAKIESNDIYIRNKILMVHVVCCAVYKSTLEDTLRITINNYEIIKVDGTNNALIIRPDDGSIPVGGFAFMAVPGNHVT